MVERSGRRNGSGSQATGQLIVSGFIPTAGSRPPDPAQSLLSLELWPWYGYRSLALRRRVMDIISTTVARRAALAIIFSAAAVAAAFAQNQRTIRFASMDTKDRKSVV